MPFQFNWFDSRKISVPTRLWQRQAHANAKGDIGRRQKYTAYLKCVANYFNLHSQTSAPKHTFAIHLFLIHVHVPYNQLAWCRMCGVRRTSALSSATRRLWNKFCGAPVKSKREILIFRSSVGRGLSSRARSRSRCV